MGQNRPPKIVGVNSQLSFTSHGMLVNALKGRDVNWLHLAIQV